MGGSGEGGVGVTSSMRLDERKWITNVYCPLPVSTLPPVETVGCGWSHVLAKTGTIIIYNVICIIIFYLCVLQSLFQD